MNRVLYLLFFTLFLTHFSFSQSISISGILQDATETPISGASVSVGDATTVTQEDGYFRLQFDLEKDPFTIVFSGAGMDETQQIVQSRGRTTISLGTVVAASADDEIPIDIPPTVDDETRDIITGEDRIPVVTLDAGDEDNTQLSGNISGILSASRDPFVAAAAYNLSTGGFRIRGFRNEAEVYFNGMPFNSLENGRVFWSVWGGLNDVTRNRETTIDLSASPYAFGGIGGVTAFDIRASEQRPQKRFSYMFSNRSYNGRIMGTWSTGMMKNGWAVSLSGSRRWAQEGYVPGTFYNAWSYFASVDKKINQDHLLNLTALGAPIRRGSQGASIDEANDLAGTNFYNPNWGYQNGEKRNARVVDAHQPLFILRHDWTISKNSSLFTALGYQTGHYGRTSLDWFNAPDPRPDYYRNLPSYYQYGLEGPEQANIRRQLFMDNPELLQIQWDDLYAANQSGKTPESILGTNPGGAWSQYALIDRRSDSRRLNGSSTYTNLVNDNLTLNIGATFQREKTHYFTEIEDLLGGDYYLNLNRFVLTDYQLFDQRANPTYHSSIVDFASSNLDDDNLVLTEGDIFQYDFDINVQRGGLWAQGQWSLRKIDFFLAGNVSQTSFWREGYFRNGLFPESSLGESAKQNFTNFGGKGGITYKFNGRNYAYANATAFNRAPTARNAFVSSRNRDDVVDYLTDEQIFSGEIGFQHRSPNVKARATLFYTTIQDQLKVNRFFLEREESNFVTYIQSGLDSRHMGAELALQAKVTQTWEVTGAVSIGEYIYTSRPTGVAIPDETGVPTAPVTIFAENFYVPGAAQTAASIGLAYRSPKYWMISANVNYFDRLYLDFNPERRTADQVFGLEQGSDFYNEVINQFRAPEAVTVDLFANKSFKINRDLFFYLTAGVTNLLDAEVITGGFEQLRYDRADVQLTGVNLFPERKFYAYGTNFFVMGAVRF